MGGGASKRAATEPAKKAARSTPSSCQLIDGSAVAAETTAALRREVEAFVQAGKAAPCLVVVLVGENPASLSYIKKKESAAKACGISARVHSLEATITQQALLDELKKLNADESVHGIIVQLPLPEHIDPTDVTAAVSPHKDVDGFGAENIGAIALTEVQPLFCPCTPKGCLRLLRSVGKPLKGLEAVVVGASNIVGMPMLLLLLREGCTVTCCHIDTKNCAAHTRTADIVVVAVGKAGLVRRDWVKPGAIVIDVGINFVEDKSKKSGKRMVGDCADEVREVAGWITPVPGGVGPMTVAMLMENTVQAAKRSHTDNGDGTQGSAAVPYDGSTVTNIAQAA